MVSKTRADYIRHFFNEIYDNTVPNSINPNTYLLNQNLNGPFKLFYNSFGWGIYNGLNRKVINADTYLMDGNNDIGDFSMPGQNPVALNYLKSMAYNGGILNTQNIDTYYGDGTGETYHKSSYDGSYPIHFNFIDDTDSHYEEWPAEVLGKLKHVVLYVRKLKDVYNFNNIYNIVDFEGNIINKQQLLNNFGDYLVPVYRLPSSDFGYGKKLRFYIETSIETLRDYQIPEYICPFEYLRDLYTGSSIEVKYCGIKAKINNIIVPVIRNTMQNFVFDDVDTSYSLVSGYTHGNRYNGMFDFGLGVVETKNTNTDYIPTGVVRPYNYRDKLRYLILSNSFNDLDNDNFYMRQEYVLDPFTEEPTLEDIYSVFNQNSPAELVWNKEIFGTQLSKSIDSKYGKYGLSNISTYYEDVDVLNRSFSFDYAGENERLAIICYNKDELENYFREWGLTWEYHDFGYIEPDPDAELPYESRKIRHILTTNHSADTVDKVRHILPTNHSVAIPEKVRHVLRGF